MNFIQGNIRFVYAVLFLVLFAVPQAEAKVVPVTPANVQANIDKLPAGATKPVQLLRV